MLLTPLQFQEMLKGQKHITGVENVIDAETRFFLNAKRRIDACMNYTRRALAVRTESIKKSFMDAKSRGIRVRILLKLRWTIWISAKR